MDAIKRGLDTLKALCQNTPMITNDYSWSLGPTQNKSLDRPQAAGGGHLKPQAAANLKSEPFIPIHPPGDPQAPASQANPVPRPFLSLTTNHLTLVFHSQGDPLATFPGKHCTHTSLALVAPPLPAPAERHVYSSRSSSDLPLQRSGMRLTR